MSYEKYYNSLKANKNGTKDLIKFDALYAHGTGKNTKILQMDKLSKYIDECIESKSPKKILNTISYDAVLDLDFNMYDEIGKELIQLMNTQYFGCNFEIHRAYLLKNNYQSNKTEKLNCDEYHWKNEPKTIITAYVMLDGDESIMMNYLGHPSHKFCIKMPSNRDSANDWGSDTHQRYKDCKFHDGHVKEFEYYGFEQYNIPFCKYNAFILGSNVIHRHVRNNNKYLVIKLRPTKDDITLNSNEEIQSRIGDILDTEVSITPY
jgi:hypothetical protein